MSLVSKFGGRFAPHETSVHETTEEDFTSLRKAEGIGAPLGTSDFLSKLERRLGRPIARRAPGRKAVPSRWASR